MRSCHHRTVRLSPSANSVFGIQPRTSLARSIDRTEAGTSIARPGLHSIGTGAPSAASTAAMTRRGRCCPATAADVEDAFGRGIVRCGLQCIDDVVDEDVIAHDRAVSPDFRALPADRARQQHGDQALPFRRQLKRAERIRDAQHAKAQPVEVLVETEEFLDRQLDDPIGGDRIGGRGFRSGNLLGGSIHGSAGRDEDDPLDVRLAADVEERKRRNDAVTEISGHVEIRRMRCRRLNQMENDLAGGDRGCQRGRVFELGLVPFNAGKLIREGAATAERAHACAGCDKPSTQIRSHESATAEHEERHGGGLAQPPTHLPTGRRPIR